jgi:Domain of unknown function (DUF4351)
MGFSQAFLDWEEATQEKGIAIGEQRGISIGQREQARSSVLRQLSRRIGILPIEVRSQVEALSLIQLDELGEALLDFDQLTHLTNWLDKLRLVLDPQIQSESAQSGNKQTK